MAAIFFWTPDVAQGVFLMPHNNSANAFSHFKLVEV